MLQVLFLRWVLTMFDMIDCKDNLRAIYGFIFSYVTDENMVSLEAIMSVAHNCFFWDMENFTSPMRTHFGSC